MMTRKLTKNLVKTRAGKTLLGAAIGLSAALGTLAATSPAASSPAAIGIWNHRPARALYAPARSGLDQAGTHAAVKRPGTGASRPVRPPTSPVTSPVTVSTGGTSQPEEPAPAVSRVILPVAKTVLSRELAQVSEKAAVFGGGGASISAGGDTITPQDVLSAADSYLSSSGFTQSQIGGLNSWVGAYQNLPANPADLSQAQITQLADAPNGFFAAAGVPQSLIDVTDQVTADSLGYIAQVAPVYQESWANGLPMTQGEMDQAVADWKNFAGELGVDPNVQASTPVGNMSISTLTAAVNFSLASGQYTYTSASQQFGVGMFQNDLNTADWQYVMQGPLGGYGAFGGYGIWWDGTQSSASLGGGGTNCPSVMVVRHGPAEPQAGGAGAAGALSGSYPQTASSPDGSNGRLHGHMVYAGCDTATA